MKQAVISLAIALCVGLFGPRSLEDVGLQIQHAAILLLRLGMILDPPHARGHSYDDGAAEEPTPNLEEARASAPEVPA